MTAELINYGLERNGYDGKAARLSFAVRDDETVQLESVTSDRYGYIPNWKITRGLQELERMGWRVPPARPNGSDPRARKATKDDVLKTKSISGLSIKVGDMIAPAGLYASDRDMFAFLVNEDVVIDGGKGTGLNRGIFVENSEVGKGAFKITTFLYDAVCGNHIVWGASEVNEISVRHIGDADIRAFLALEDDLSRYAYESCRDTETAIASARKKTLGKGRDQVVERLFGKRWLPKSTFAEAFDRAAELDADRVDPTTVWGMVTGLTRVSQDQAWADERVHIDRVTGRLMAMAA
jgi:hypothetical protein